ncbi:hypothetical protein GRAQ_03975 [Rahnella aquatilis CIP 78.65 = ATCC 33071]|nr:hypothetical protein GRAQ_03975 [Rahnella aquatilis CIP 78.65 = ATCC 33071]
MLPCCNSSYFGYELGRMCEKGNKKGDLLSKVAFLLHAGQTIIR